MPSPPPPPPIYSALASIQYFYNNNLNPSAFPNSVLPNMYFAESPVTAKTTGIQQLPPFVVLTDRGVAPGLANNRGVDWAEGPSLAIFQGSVELSAYYLSLGDADACIEAIKWNGQSPNLCAGLAFSQLVFTPPYYSKQFNMIPVRQTRGYAGLGVLDQRIHKSSIEFSYRIYLNPLNTET